MSTEPTTEMMNEVIGVFCGNRVHMKGDEKWLLNDSLLGWPVTDLRYHESWTWLMPVVEKIHGLAVAGDAINAITEEAIFTFSILPH